MSRQKGATGHGQFGLVCQVAGAGASYDFYRDELVQAGAWGQSDLPAYEYMAESDYMGQTGYAQALATPTLPMIPPRTASRRVTCSPSGARAQRAAGPLRAIGHTRGPAFKLPEAIAKPPSRAPAIKTLAT